MSYDTVQETGIKIIPLEKKCIKEKRLSEEALQIAVKRREATGKGEKERYKHLNAELLIFKHTGVGYIFFSRGSSQPRDQT